LLNPANYLGVAVALADAAVREAGEAGDARGSREAGDARGSREGGDGAEEPGA
jgi:hypothetical protein